jgi:hydroxymethylbilane synthase
MNLRIGSRGSQLALWQANHIAALLRSRGHIVEIQIIKTTGDRQQEVTFAQVGSKGMFTKEIEDALNAGKIDLAVHSLKDLPTELPDPFALAATPMRVDPRDAFVSPNYSNLTSLPHGATVGTSSLRRRAQLKALRPDIVTIEFRGNVDTRLRKLEEGKADAILLAAAGLDRLEKTEWIRERLDPRDFCPAPGQGALAIETRKRDHATISAVAFLDDASTRFAVTAERAALTALGGGCQVPIGVHCRVPQVRVLEPGKEQGSSSNSNGEVEIFAVVADPETGRAVQIHHRAPRTGDGTALGQLAAQMLLENGAAALLEHVAPSSTGASA